MRYNWSGLKFLQVIYFCKCNRPKFGFDDYYHKRNPHNRLVLSDWLCHIDILNCTASLPAYMTKTFMAKSFGQQCDFCTLLVTNIVHPNLVMSITTSKFYTWRAPRFSSFAIEFLLNIKTLNCFKCSKFSIFSMMLLQSDRCLRFTRASRFSMY